MVVVVTGGTGYVGTAIQRHLVARGHTVRVLARKGRVVPGADFFPADLATADLTQSFAGADAVIHLVGIIREDPARGVRFETVHAGMTQRVIRAMAVLGIPRLIHMSALGTRPHATARYHRTKWEAEEMVRQSPEIRWTIVRPSLIFGGGAEFFRLLERQSRWPVVPVPGDGQTLFQPVYREDVARFFIAALERPETVAQTYELGGPGRYTLEDLYRLAAPPDKALKFFHVSLALMMASARFGQHLPGFPVTVDQLLMLAEPNITDDSRWEAVCGRATPLTPSLLP